MSLPKLIPSSISDHMNKLFVNAVRFVALILLQIMVLNHIRIGGYVNPYVYPLFVLLLPFTFPGWLLLIVGFLLGFTMDLMMSTPGLHTAATVWMAFMRAPIIRLASGRPLPENADEPSVSQLGGYWFLTYSISLITLHHLALFLLESFSTDQIGSSLYRTLLSVPVSEMLILLLVYLFRPTKKR